MLKRNIIANYLGQGVAAIMALAFIPTYIGYLGVEAYGLIGVFTVMQTWFVLLDMGASQTLAREMSRFTAGMYSGKSIWVLLRSLEAVIYLVACCSVIAIWLCSDWVATQWLSAEKLPDERVARALAVAGLVVGLRIIEGVYRNVLLGLQRQVWFNCAHAVIATLRFGGVVAVLAFVSPTIEAFFYWQVLVSALAVMVYAIKVYSLLPRIGVIVWPSRRALASVIGFAGGLFGINLLSVILTQIDKVILSRLLSLEYFGYYVLAATLAGGISLVIGPITQALYPRLVELHATSDEAGFSRLFHLGAQLVTLASAPIMLTMAFFSDELLYLWSGDADLARNAGYLLMPLALGFFLNSLMWMPYQSQLATGWTRLSLVINLLAVGILVPLILHFVPEYGAVAAAWIWVLLNAGYILVVAQLMHRRILRGEKARWYLADLITPVLGALLALSVIKYLVFPGMEIDSRIEMGIAVFLAYAVVLVLVAPLCNQIWPRVRNRFLTSSAQSFF